LYELCGIGADDQPPSDGVNLLATLASGGAPDRSIYADSVNILSYEPVQGIRDVKNDMLFAAVQVQGRWKYIHHFARPNDSQLFDLVADPRELVNRFSEQPQVVTGLRQLDIGKGHVPDQQLDHYGISEAPSSRWLNS
jgi:hypothetical protein